jgi:hypothetical protein
MTVRAATDVASGSNRRLAWSAAIITRENNVMVAIFLRAANTGRRRETNDNP